MTEHFEVLERDGAARLAELRLDSPLTTPALIGDRLHDAESEWVADRDPPSGDPSMLTLLPHRALPAGTDDRVRSAFGVDTDPIDSPSAAVIAPGDEPTTPVDAYVLSGTPALTDRAGRFVEAVTAVRAMIPPDTALLASGIATTATVPTLVSAGVDLVDDHRAVVRGTQGWYQTTDGERRLADLAELPCACPACAVGIDTFDRDGCVEHNRRALRAALATTRERIRAGRLRDYLEGQARHEQWTTAVLRRLDERWDYLEPRTPLLRRSEITAATDDTLRRVEIRRFADRVTNRYVCRFDAPLVLLPCSARKPYGDSQSHGQFRDAIRWRGHVASMTSPIGVVPRELELTYPAQHYDSVVTGRWSATEIEFVADVLGRYLDRTDYPRIVAHVPDDGYRTVVERATADRSIPVEYTVEDHPTADDSLVNLSASLEGEPAYLKRERERNTVRAIADYQFGPGAGDDLFNPFSVSGRFPKHRVFDGDDQLAALVPEYGLLALGLAGARRWVESDVPTRTVEIDGFVPHGSVLAPGIETADPDIRIGDDVVVSGPQAFGVGRAVMHGSEMARSTRGVAVDVRHVEER